MNPATQLIPSSELKTHRLTVHPDRHTSKTFLLTRAAATKVAESLNSRNSFIVLGGSAQAYPKQGAVLEEIGKEEHQKMTRNFVDYWDSYVVGSVVVDGASRGLYCRRLIRQMPGNRTEVLQQQAGYWQDGDFVVTKQHAAVPVGTQTHATL